MPKHRKTADVDALKSEFRYDDDLGIIFRRSTGKPAGSHAENSGNRVQTNQGKLTARSIVIALKESRFVPSVRIYHHDENIYNDRYENLWYVPDTMHRCGRCHQVLPKSEFNKRPRPRSALESYCKSCKLESTKNTRAIYEHRKKLEFFGITQNQFDLMSRAQKHCCAICRTPATTRRLSIDHCHNTGKVRGLLCHKCNTAIGKLADDPQRVLRAAQYLLGKLDYRDVGK